MVELLLKIFVKDYKNTDNEAVRTKYGLLGSFFGIFTNLILFVSKLIVGLLTWNISIIADAINNLSDFGNCFLAVFGFKVSSKPADADHPYGHQRMEYIISMIISVIIIVLGLFTGYQAVLSIITPDEALTSFPTASIIVLSCAILLKLLQSYVYYSLGKRVNSIALKANGADARNDVLSTSAVLIGLFVSYYTKFTRIDGILALVVALFIIYTGISILRKSIDILLGEKPSNEIIKKFIAIIKSNDNVLGLHDLEMHCYGPNAIFASVHVEVDGARNVFDSHDMIDNLENECYKKLGIKTVIHMDPVKLHDPETERCKKIVLSAVKEVDDRLSIHDFRIVSGPTHINAVFDIVVPHDLKRSKKSITDAIDYRVRKADPKIHSVINIDEQYTMLSTEND